MRGPKYDEQAKINPRDDHLESPRDIRKIKQLVDKSDDLLEVVEYKADLIAVAENRRWWSGTHKKLKAALAYLATLIAAVVGTMAILEKFRGK